MDTLTATGPIVFSGKLVESVSPAARANIQRVASPEIHAQIRRLAEEGTAVVVISSYLPEVLSYSDRILVGRLGHIVAEFEAANATEDKMKTR